MQGCNEFAAHFDVPRETLTRLTRFSELLVRWNARINLVSPSTTPVLWRRHLIDSAQIWMLAHPHNGTFIDLGSGAGLPGVVVAIMDESRSFDIHLVESDSRKCAFLAAVARELSLDFRIHRQRIEAATLPPANVITARALAPLHRLLTLSAPHRAANGTAFFPKGRNFEKELDEARRLWNFDYTLHQSMTDPNAAVIEIGAIDGPA